MLNESTNYDAAFSDYRDESKTGLARELARMNERFRIKI